MITSVVGWINFDSELSLFSSPNNSEQTKKILVWQIFPTCTKCLFAGRSYSTYTIKSVSSIWALVLLVTVRTTWGGMFGCWSYCRKFKGVGEGEHGAHPFWGGGMDCFFFNQFGRRVCMETGAFLKHPKG